MELRKQSLPQDCAEKLCLEQFVALTEKLLSETKKDLSWSYDSPFCGNPDA
jgi:hypothetical protein